MQTSLTPKLAMAEVATDSPYVTAAPVLPELTADNAATRYVFVPASEFGAEGIGGYVARCALPPPAHSISSTHGGEQVARSCRQLTRIALHTVRCSIVPKPAGS